MLPCTVWDQLPEGTKKTWATNLLIKKWGKRWLVIHSCERASQPLTCLQDGANFPQNRRTEAGVLAAFSSGRLVMSISILQCVGYDLDIVAAVGEAQKAWIDGTVGSAKRHVQGQARRWLLTNTGRAWLNDTKAGREWLSGDAIGRRFVQLTTKDDQMRWAAERMTADWRRKYLGVVDNKRKRKAAAKGEERSGKRSRVAPSDERTKIKDDSDDSQTVRLSRSTRRMRHARVVTSTVRFSRTGIAA